MTEAPVPDEEQPEKSSPNISYVIKMKNVRGAQIGSSNTLENHSTPRKGSKQKRGTEDSSGLIDRKQERRQLETQLLHGGADVIVVDGDPGTGKSAIVDDVLNRLEESHGLQVHRYEASPTPPDVMTLIQALEPGGSAAGLSASQSPKIRLDAALDDLADTRVVIVIESAQHLLEATRLRDEDLDLALECIVRHPTAWIKVLLVGASPRASIPGHSWTPKTVPVEPLELKFYRAFVKSLGPPAMGGLSCFDDDEIAELHARLRGNLRLTQILDVVVRHGGRFRLDNTIAELAWLGEEEIPQVLRQELVAALAWARGRVLQALAAFGTHVDEALVGHLLAAEGVTAVEVTDALEILTNWHIVHRSAGARYWIPDADELLPPAGVRVDPSDPDDSRSDLLQRAAHALRDRRLALDDLQRASDLDSWFAEIDVRIRAGQFDRAHMIIEVLDEVVRRWNRGDLLMGRRKQVRGALSDTQQSMRNHNALGDLYASRRDFGKARTEYDAALHLSRTHESPGLKVRLNIARMNFECNEIAQAEKMFSDVLGVSQETGNAKTEITALEGLADCARRSGRYATAVALAHEALSRADGSDSAKATGLAIRLARWAADLGDTAAAMRHQAEAESYDVPVLTAACLDSRADLLLDVQGDQAHLFEVVKLAEQALALARPMRDPVVLVQGRTTLAMAHLLQGDAAAATTDIEIAARYRRPGRSLIVLALKAVVTRRRHRPAGDRLFKDLLDESEERHGGRKTADFAAWHFEGLARCGLHRPGGSLELAVLAFITAQEMTRRTPTPGLVNPLIYLIEQFTEDGDPRQIFAPVLTVLTESALGPNSR